MSNGLYTRVEELIRGGDFPQEVSNDLILAAVLDNTKRNRKNTEDIKELQQSDKRWKGFTITVTAIAAYFGLTAVPK